MMDTLTVIDRIAHSDVQSFESAGVLIRQDRWLDSMSADEYAAMLVTAASVSVSNG